MSILHRSWRERQRSAAFLLTVFTLVWSGFVLLLWQFDAPWLFRVLFALANLLLLGGTLDLWLTRREVRVGREGVEFRSGFLALGRRRRIPAAEVDDFEIDRGMQMGNKLYYRVLLSHGKHRFTLADKLASLALAERLAAWWRQDLGKRSI